MHPAEQAVIDRVLAAIEKAEAAGWRWTLLVSVSGVRRRLSRWHAVRMAGDGTAAACGVIPSDYIQGGRALWGACARPGYPPDVGAVCWTCERAASEGRLAPEGIVNVPARAPVWPMRKRESEGEGDAV